jgi:hypothetical protein
MTEPKKIGFSAESELDELSFNFRPYVEVEGVIPEPSAAQIKQFQKALRTLFGDSLVEQARAVEKGGITAADVEKAIRDFDEDDESEKLEQLFQAVARVCSDIPNYIQLSALPYRMQQHFLGWIMGKFLVGGATPATTP